MNLSLPQLKELVLELEKTRRDSVVGQAHYCREPIVGKDGKTYRLEAKPKGRKHILQKYGFEVVDKNGVLHVKIPHGVHGRAFLGIDPETKEVTCLACKEQNNGA